jgi:DNA-directed RNA polymerase subunit K/omega
VKSRKPAFVAIKGVEQNRVPYEILEEDKEDKEEDEEP